MLLPLIVLALYAKWGHRFMGESAAGPIGTGMLLGMVGFALVWVAQLPFDVAELWWERRHHLTHVGYAARVFGDQQALGFTPLADGLAELGLTLCDTPDCGLSAATAANRLLPSVP